MQFAKKHCVGRYIQNFNLVIFGENAIVNSTDAINGVPSAVQRRTVLDLGYTILPHLNVPAVSLQQAGISQSLMFLIFVKSPLHKASMLRKILSASQSHHLRLIR